MQRDSWLIYILKHEIYLWQVASETEVFPETSLSFPNASCRILSSHFLNLLGTKKMMEEAELLSRARPQTKTPPVAAFQPILLHRGASPFGGTHSYLCTACQYFKPNMSGSTCPRADFPLCPLFPLCLFHHPRW